MTTKSQHLNQASLQLHIAASALVHARRHLAHAGYGQDSAYLTELASSLFDTGHDLQHHTIHPED